MSDLLGNGWTKESRNYQPVAIATNNLTNVAAIDIGFENSRRKVHGKAIQ